MRLLSRLLAERSLISGERAAPFPSIHFIAIGNERMKPSRYNFWATFNPDQHLLFNGISGALYELTSQEKDTVLKILSAPGGRDFLAESEMQQSLVDGGFLIPGHVDEIYLLTKQARAACAPHEILELFLVPTYECNFRCKYCYVNFKTGVMSREVERRIVKYFERVLPQYRQVNVTWFGGEPLLRLETVMRVSTKMTELASEHQTQLYSMVSTNGYLLSREAVRELFKAGIRFFHLTIDGPAVYHDQRRPLSSGRPTYERVKENLNNVLREIEESRITLRMNADDSSVDSFYQVLDDVPPAYRHRIQVNITPILVGDRSPSLELYRRINLVLRCALRSGFLYYDNQIPLGRKTFCQADKSGNLQIGPEWTLYKCSPGKDKQGVEVGGLDAEGVAHFTQAKALGWFIQARPTQWSRTSSSGCVKMARLRKTLARIF